MNIEKMIENVMQTIIPESIKSFILEKAMTDELFYDHILQEGSRVVILGEAKTNKLLIKRLIRNKVYTRSCNNYHNFEGVMQKNGSEIRKCDYMYIITDQYFEKWMEVLKKFEIPSSRFLVFQIFPLHAKRK